MPLSRIVLKYSWRILRFVWESLPDEMFSLKPFGALGLFIHRQACLRQKRQQTSYTRFLRNVPHLKILRDIVNQKAYGSSVKILSIGCSTGGELYSTLWAIRSTRPDLNVIACGLDISDAAIEKARSEREAAAKSS